MNESLPPGAAAAGGVEVGRLPPALKLGWGSGALGAAILLNGIGLLILFYLVGILDIEPALAGTIVFVAKLFDVVSDPVVGVWSDRSSSPRGRRRPFLLWGAVIGGASFAMIFTTPLFEEQWMRVAYVFLALCIYTLGYTLFNIPYMAMPAEMTDDYHERSSIHAYRIIFVAIGAFLGASIAPALLEQLGKGEWDSYALIGVAGGIIVFVAMITAYATTSRARHTHRGEAVPDLRGEFDAVRKNRHFLRLIGVKFAQLTGVQSTQAAMLFFIVQTLQLDLTILVWFGIAVTASTMLSAPLLVRLSRTLGKRGGYYCAGGAYVIYSLSWLLAGPGEPIWAIVLRAVIVGFAAAGNVVLAMSMLTDIINHDARFSGVRREGVFTSLYSFVEKVTAALGPLIIGVALSAVGFDKDLPPDQLQGEDVQLILKLLVSVLPAVCGIVALWLLSGYRLSEAEVQGDARPVTPEGNAPAAASESRGAN